MPTLAELQQSLQDFLLDKPADAESLTLESAQFSRQQRLQIYHQAYRLRLIDTLHNDYPALAKTLGEDKFAAVCQEFIAAHPSQHPSLRWLGEQLPGFLQESAQQIHVIELAQFEWSQTMAFDAADARLATVDELRALAPEKWLGLRLEFHPSVQLLSLRSNAPDIWNAQVKQDSQETIAVALADQPQNWLVWREDLQVVYRQLEQPEASAMGAFLDGKNFAEVCGELCSWFAEEQIPVQAARYLQQWLLGGLVSRLG